MPEMTNALRSPTPIPSDQNESRLSTADQLACVKPFVDEARAAAREVKRSPFRFARAIKALRIAYRRATGDNPTNGWIAGQLGDDDDDELSPQRIGQIMKVADFFASSMNIEEVKGASFKSFEVAIQENERAVVQKTPSQLLQIIKDNPIPKVIKAKLNREPLLVFEVADDEGGFGCRIRRPDDRCSTLHLTVAALAAQAAAADWATNMLKGAMFSNLHHDDEIRTMIEDVESTIRGYLPADRRDELLSLLHQHADRIIQPSSPATEIADEQQQPVETSSEQERPEATETEIENPLLKVGYEQTEPSASETAVHVEDDFDFDETNNAPTSGETNSSATDEQQIGLAQEM